MNGTGLRTATAVLALLALLGLAACASVAPDYAREKRLADEFVPSMVEGRVVTIETHAGLKFLGILTEARKPRAAVILVHGLGVHPDFGLIGDLRSRLPERGYTTLSIQMPVLAADADRSLYPAIFAEADERIAAALDYLRPRVPVKVAIVSHSMGARMVNDFLKKRPDAPLMAWLPVAISSGEFDALPALRFPVFDIYAQKDFDVVRKGAADRASALRRIKGSKQAMVYGADHYFTKKEKEVAALIDKLLTPLAK